MNRTAAIGVMAVFVAVCVSAYVTAADHNLPSILESHH